VNESAPSERSCAACGTPLPAGSRFCPGCGAAVDAQGGETQAFDVPPTETGPIPVSYERVEPRYFGVTPPMLLFGIALGGLAGGIVLFATGHWPIGLILIGIAVLAGVGFAEVARRKPDTAVTRVSAEALYGFRARAGSALESLAARGRAGADTLRTRRELARLAAQRLERLAALGDAVYRGDPTATREARARVAELDQRAAALEHELEERLDAAQERIRKARLEVQATQMLEVQEPYPPPDEVTIPQPDPVPTRITPEPSPGPPTPDPVPTPIAPEPDEPPRPEP
jgi:hypothetical protein